MKETILILSNSIEGLFSFRKEVMIAIKDRGYNVVISCPHGSIEASQFFANAGIRIIDTNVDRRGINPIRDIILTLHYLILFIKERPSVVLTYTIKPNIYGGIIARWFHVPQLANITGLGTSLENPGLLRKISIALYRFGLKKTHMVFYQNSSILDFCNLNHIGKGGRLLPGSGVNLEWHSFQEYPNPSETMKFNYIGRVMKDKGIEEFLIMVSAIHKQYPFTEFHILGECEGAYKPQLLELQEKGGIIWHGAVSDVRPFIKDSFATIHPSYHEGMANAILESCAAGRPVIASRISGCKEAIEDGVNGYLCLVKNAHDLTDKVGSFINLSYEEKCRMGKNARIKMEQGFNRDIVIEAYVSAINSILQTR